jgi:hypothetical protein
MGRLTLNVLLSFAQFEREVTGERIRDKVAASKKKGMWMGGPVPIGYDVVGKRLVVNPKEAKIVQEIFEQYLRLGSVAELKKYLDHKRIRTKLRTSGDGHVFGGQPYSRGALYKLLNNRLYLGQIAHRGQIHVGQHPGLISHEIWTKASELLTANNQGQRRPGRISAPSVLAGLVFDAQGNRYTPTHAIKGERRYRYYTSQAVIQNRKKPSRLDRIPAKELEDVVSTRIQELLNSPDQLIEAWEEGGSDPASLPESADAARSLATDWSTLTSTERADILKRALQRVVIYAAEVQIRVDVAGLSACLLERDSGPQVKPDNRKNTAQHITICAVLRHARHRGTLRLALPGTPLPFERSNSSLLRAVVQAQQWKQRVLNGEIYSKEQLASAARLNASYVSRILRTAALGPECINAIVQHRAVLRRPLARALKWIPLDWTLQRSFLLHA